MIPRDLRALLSVPDTPAAQRLLRSSAAVTVVSNVAFMASVLLIDRPASGYLTLWDGWMYHVAITAPAVMSGVRAAYDRRSSIGWWLITAGIALNTAANLIFTYHDQNLTPVPFPALSDGPYLLSYLAFAIALAWFTQKQTGHVSRALRLDGLVIGLASGAIAVGLWFDSILAQTGSAAAVVVGIAYPLFDLVFIVIVVSGLAPVRFRPTWSATTLMAGAVAFAIGDIVYLNRVAADTYRPGTILEWSWMLGMVAFGFAAWVPSDARRRATTPHRAQVLAVVPVVAAAGALVVVTFGVAGDVPSLASWLAIAAIGAALGRVALTVRELRQANEAISQARTDDLTGLLNRRGFAQRLDAALARPEPRLSVLMIDLNGFKEVNDSLGHHAGDHLLAVVGERFDRALPEHAFVARLGGDEFGIVVPGPPDVAEAATAELLTTLDDPVSVDGISIRIGASIGIAVAPADGTTRQDLLRAADVAMYDAKNNQLGSARYDDERDPHSRERLALIEDLRTAIDYRAFEMHYQPTVDVRTGEIVGMEALIRWNHPELGMLPPNEFVPIAERVGLIPAITRAVLDLSIAHLAETRRNGHRLGLSVNISAMDLVDDDLPRYVRSTLAAHGVPANLLTLEITETALSSDAVRAERTLHAVRADGVRVSIDDFGVGYSSMSQLLKLPLDELKIDRSFIASLDEDVRARAILSATVELGRTLGLGIVAEGIETVEALDEVTIRGVETAQGYYFSKALPPLAFDEFVRAVSPEPAGARTSRHSPRSTPFG